MRTIRTKVYQFNELTETAQKKAIEWYKTILNNDGDILQFFNEYAKEKASENGFDNIKLQYSLSNCQGDGLSFSCDNFDIEKFLNENSRLHRPLFIKVLSANLKVEMKGNTGRYCFASRSDIDLYLDNYKRNYPNIESLIECIKVELQDKYMALCRELEGEGYKEIESRYEDESIIEDIEANEYEFKADGTRY